LSTLELSSQTGQGDLRPPLQLVVNMSWHLWNRVQLQITQECAPIKKQDLMQIISDASWPARHL